MNIEELQEKFRITAMFDLGLQRKTSREAAFETSVRMRMKPVIKPEEPDLEPGIVGWYVDERFYERVADPQGLREAIDLAVLAAVRQVLDQA
jgi:hypothetical protein